MSEFFKKTASQPFHSIPWDEAEPGTMFSIMCENMDGPIELLYKIAKRNGVEIIHTRKEESRQIDFYVMSVEKIDYNENTKDMILENLLSGKKTTSELYGVCGTNRPALMKVLNFLERSGKIKKDHYKNPAGGRPTFMWSVK